MNTNKGFSLIEVIVAILIAGILTAIATPFLFNLVDKALEAEPISYLNSALKLQKEKYSESSEFLQTWTELQVSAEVTKNYSYEVIDLKDNNQLSVGMLATPSNSRLKAYLAGIAPAIKKNNLIFVSVICQAKLPGINQFTKNSLIKVKKQRMKCSSNSLEVGR